MPRCAATAATWRVWFDWMPPIDTSVSQPCASASGNQVFELARLVAAEGQAAVAVLALGVQLDLAAQVRAQALQGLDRRRAEGQRMAGEALEVHGS